MYAFHIVKLIRKIYFLCQVTDEIYQHIDVREEGKTNAFSLGNSLWIGTEEFEDLDEIIARQDTDHYIIKGTFKKHNAVIK